MMQRWPSNVEDFSASSTATWSIARCKFFCKWVSERDKTLTDRYSIHKIESDSATLAKSLRCNVRRKDPDREGAASDSDEGEGGTDDGEEENDEKKSEAGDDEEFSSIETDSIGGRTVVCSSPDNFVVTITTGAGNVADEPSDDVSAESDTVNQGTLSVTQTVSGSAASSLPSRISPTAAKSSIGVGAEQVESSLGSLTSNLKRSRHYVESQGGSRVMQTTISRENKVTKKSNAAQNKKTVSFKI